MPGSIRIGGSWATVIPSVKVGGAWKQVRSGHVKVGGSWKQWHVAQGPTVRTIGATGSTSAGSTISIAYPTFETGDLLIAVVTSIGGATLTPSGWSKPVSIAKETSSAGAYSTLTIWTRVSDGSESGSQTFTFANAATSSAVGFMMSVKNPAAVTAISGTSSKSDTSSSTITFNAPSSVSGISPLHIQVGAQCGYAYGTTPTFSSYTGSGSLINSVSLDTTTSRFRVSLYAKESAAGSTSATMSSNVNDSWVSTSFYVNSI